VVTPLRRTTVALVGVALTLLAAGCATEDDWSEPRSVVPSGEGALGAAFYPAVPPPPEGTITPSPGSWDEVRPPAGYRVVLLTSGTDPQTRVLTDAVRDWANAYDVSLRTVVPEDAHDLVPSVQRAMDLGPDLVIGAGHDVVDPLAAVTPSHLDQQFLVVGAELAEPTGNVTAADWAGASFRGEGLGMSSDYDPATFTPARARDAVRAGTAAVLKGKTGIVVWVP
jgi:hypothetical protein